MNNIVLIVPYFGKLPYNFQLWLEGCRYNQDIDWLFFTDDTTSYDYPSNVTVNYCSFDEMKKRIGKLYDFEIVLDKAYKLCDYRTAYGEIFKDEIKNYKYWGYCDVDLLFGHITDFITEDILESYEKIGFQGHLTIYRNNYETVMRYRTQVIGIPNYKEIFTSNEACFFDENVIDSLYKYLNIPVYMQVHFAHLAKYCPDFYLKHVPKNEIYKNKDQIFSWENGKLYRHYLHEGKAFSEECMYIHFFCRKMTLKIDEYSKNMRLIIYPNRIETFDDVITEKTIKKKAHTSKIIFKVKYLYRNRNRISIHKLAQSVRLQRKQRKELKY